MQDADIGYDFYGHMELYDSTDRDSIEWSLLCVFKNDERRINWAIGAEVSEIPDWIHYNALLV